MKKTTATSILSFAIFISFFLPIFEWHSFEMSGPNYILSTHIPAYKYLLLLIPFAAFFLFLGSLNDENYFFNRKILACVPLLSVVFIFIMRYMNVSSENNFSDNGKDLSGIDLGFWLILFFSFLLVLLNATGKHVSVRKTELESFE